MSDREQLPSGSVYAALFQRSGRGQAGNRWESRPGDNLLFSLLFRPGDLPSGCQFALSQAASLAVCDHLALRGLEALVKWPNDIICVGRKICGILIENSICDGRVASAVIGIGLNVNQTAFPPQAPNATSMATATGASYDIRTELESLLDCLGRRLPLCEDASGRLKLGEEYHSRLYRLGRWQLYRERGAADALTPTTEPVAGKVFEGMILGVSPAGTLTVGLRDGSRREFAFKEISYVI